MLSNEQEYTFKDKRKCFYSCGQTKELIAKPTVGNQN